MYILTGIQQQVLLLFLSALFGVKVLKIVQLFPKTFSFGEGVMVCQISTSAFFRFICLWVSGTTMCEPMASSVWVRFGVNYM